MKEQDKNQQLEEYEKFKRMRTEYHSNIQHFQEIGTNPRKILKSQCSFQKLYASEAQIKNAYQSINQVPTVELTMEQMQKDPIKLFFQLQQKYSEFGAVKVVACPQWKPPFCFGKKDLKITTRIQDIHKLSQGKPFCQKKQYYTYDTFSNAAKSFEENYKYKTNPIGNTILAKNQMEYWAIINSGSSKDTQYEHTYAFKKKHRLAVQYAADIQAQIYGSGFPTKQNIQNEDENFHYATNYFNLNNICKSPLSLMKICKQNEKISGINSPWIYLGMIFSTFCWHVEDFWLNSLNYSHQGAIKTWYVISSSEKQKFDVFIKKKTRRQDALDSITYMVDPIQIMKAGIKVYKIYQAPKQYVCTFFKAYHCGFSNGFNVGEAVNFAYPKSYKYMNDAVKSYRKMKNNKLLVFPIQWPLHANRNNQFGQFDGIMKEYYDNLVKQEQKQIRLALNFIVKIQQVREFLDIQTSYQQNMCAICQQYMYLWFLKCSKCNKKYCKYHKQNCCGNISLQIRQLEGKRKQIRHILSKQIKK